MLTNVFVINIMLITDEKICKKIFNVFNKMLKRKRDNMKINFTEEQMKKILTLYFKECLGMEGEVITTIKIIETGYNRNPYKKVVVKNVFQHTREILGEKISSEIMITEPMVKEAFTYVLDQENLTVEEMKYCTEIKSRWTGYGMAEHLNEKANFYGVDLIVQSKKKKKRKGVMA